VLEVIGHRSQVTGAVLVGLFLAGCGSSGSGAETGPNEVGTSPIAVASPDFRDGGTIPKRFTCDGGGARPRIDWNGVPPGAQDVALLVGDPDAPGGTYVHWTVWNLPRAKESGLGAGALPAGAIQGANSAGSVGWTPPCPPKGARPHHYVFGIYATRTRLRFQQGEDPSKVVPAVRAAAIASGSLTASYGR
jgi:Raf kinase inhibitor-like YbhB/YbcL family protein